MTKTSKRKLIVSAALLLAGVASVGATFGALVLNDGNRSELLDGPTINVDVSKSTLEVGAQLNSGNATVVVDGYNQLSDNSINAGIVNGTVQNDLSFSIDFTITGHPDLWTKLNVAFAWGSGDDGVGTYLSLPTDEDGVLKEALSLSSGSEASSVYSGTVSYDLAWKSTYSEGMVAYLNKKYTTNTEENRTAAWNAMEDFQTAVNSATIQVTVTLVEAE